MFSHGRSPDSQFQLQIKNGQVASSTYIQSPSCVNPGSNILPIIFIGRHPILRISLMDLAQVLYVSHAMVQLKQPRKLNLPGNAMLGLHAPAIWLHRLRSYRVGSWHRLPNHWIHFRMTLPDPFLNKSQLLKDLQGRFYERQFLIAGLWQWKQGIAKPQKGAQLDHQHDHKVTPPTATTFHHHPSCITCRPATFQRPTADKFGATSSVSLSTTLATTSQHDTWMRRQWDQNTLRSKTHFWQLTGKYHITSTLLEAKRTRIKLCIDYRCHMLNEQNMNNQASILTCRGAGASYHSGPTSRERHHLPAMS